MDEDTEVLNVRARIDTQEQAVLCVGSSTFLFFEEGKSRIRLLLRFLCRALQMHKSQSWKFHISLS